MSKISTVELGDLIEFQRGFDLPKSQMIEGEFPVRSSNGILGYHYEYKVTGPGITIGRSGTVGIPHLIKTNFFPHNTSLFIKDFKGNNVEYIYYLLKNIRLGDRKSGSGVPTMNRNHLHPLGILAYTDNRIQSQIAKILSDLDSKIELNNKINSVLEGIAKTIYNYWFVQFDFPDENGKPYKTSGGKMIYNDVLKREIPEGWQDKTIGDYCKSTGGYAFKSTWWSETGEPVVKIKDIQEDNSINTSAISYADLSGKVVDEKFICKPGDVLIAMTGATVGKFGIVPFTEKPLYVNQRVGHFNLGINSTAKLPFLINSLNQKYFREVVFVLASGVAQPNISNEQINSIKLILPTDVLINKFNNNMKQYYDKILNNLKENQKLADLRDWLLPMLMNGQVTVKEAKEPIFIIP